MNYRNAALAELTALATETENYKECNESRTLTVGQVLLAVLKGKPEGQVLNEWLMRVSDEDMYTLIEEIKFLLFKIPTNVIKKIKEGAMTTEIKAPSILF